MAHGASMGISRDVSALLDELAEVKPTLLYAVPQLFKRVCDAIHAKVRCRISRRFCRVAFVESWVNCISWCVEGSHEGFWQGCESLGQCVCQGRWGGCLFEMASSKGWTFGN